MTRTLSILLTVAVASTLAAPTVARADDERDPERITLNFRGSGLFRADDGYADHADVFGYPGMGAGGGGVIELGARIAPRLSIYGSWSGFGSVAQKRMSELRIMSQAVLGHVRYTVSRADWQQDDHWFTVKLDASVGGGLYVLTEHLDDQSRTDRSAGARAGLHLDFYWKNIGYGVVYGYHYAPASLTDRLGGTLRAGGHEIAGGLTIRF